jgi:hypothetical protein
MSLEGDMGGLAENVASCHFGASLNGRFPLGYNLGPRASVAATPLVLDSVIVTIPT